MTLPRSGWLAIGAVVSSLLLSETARPWPLLTAAVAILVLAATPWWPARARMPGRVSLAGTAAVALHLALVSPAIEAPAAAPVGQGPWTMVVESLGSPRDGHQIATLRDAGSGTVPRLAATLPAYPVVEPGSVVEVRGRARPRPDSSFGRYLARIDVWGTLDADSLSLRPTQPSLGQALERLRRGAGDALASVLPEPEAGLAAGILIGLRDRVDRGVAADFTTAGVSHVVAISGWNIAIVGAMVAGLAGRLSRRRRSVLIAIAIASYVAFAGASPSVLRAGVMAAVVLLARETGRAGRAAAALGWAVSILLVIDPGLIRDAGFQLSSLATAGLMAWATPTTAWIDRATRGRLPSWLAENLGVSLAAQAATLPVILVSFGRLALVAPAVNLIVVPIVAPAMAVGVLALAGGVLVGLGAPGAIGSILAAPGWVALRVMIGVVQVGASVPFASLSLGPLEASGLAVASVLIGVAVVLRHGRPPRGATAAAAGRPVRDGAAARATPPSRAQRLAVGALVASVAVMTGVVVTRPGGVSRVVILDVGQGDAILVEGAHSGRLLVDGGPDPDRLLVELDRHVPPWDRRIDVLVLSHPHEDHVAGLARLFDRYRVRRVFEPGMRGPGPGYAAWSDRLARPGGPTDGLLAEGDQLHVDDIDLRVLWPIRGRVPREPPNGGTGINNVSIVFLGTVDRRRFLLAGDVEQDIDPMLLSEGLPHVDLLKVAHHGSRTATTQPFVDAVRPRIAVASAGAGNPYGHPARSTLERLAASGARVLRTDEDGTVTVSFEATGTAVRTEPRHRASTHGVVPAKVARAVADANGPIAFGCRIARPPTATAAASRPAAVDPGTGEAHPATDPPDRSSMLGYHRVDDGAPSGEGRCPAVLPGSSALVPRPRARRGRDRRVAGRADRGSRDRRRPTPRRGGRPPP